MTAKPHDQGSPPSDQVRVDRRSMLLSGSSLALASTVGAALTGSAQAQETTPATPAPASAGATEMPNILVIWGDDIGQSNISAYTRGLMGYRTPNIDRIANEGALFTDAYGEQSCTAGRAAFILGQHPFRTGLLTIGMPGSPHGIPEWAPTIADVMKGKGYATGQFGKNHLGDQDEHLPTNHGFDEFFGNLYHLNAEEEPEGYYYPKDPAFREKYGPRGVIHSRADGQIEDTGPLTRKRMETIDEEILQHATDFIDRNAAASKPFFVWFNTTRMHVWTHLKPESVGTTGVGLYPDGMVEHDGHVGQLLKKLDDLGIADNTIVMYSTDNGAEEVSWPDGGTTPFKGEKGTTWEGGHRVPMLVRWPGVIEPGTVINEPVAHNDWMPTFAAAAGEPDLVQKMAQGYTTNNKTFKVHLDGYNLVPLLKGEVEEGPRDFYLYFSQAGELNAARWGDWKIHFAVIRGNIATGTRETPGWPLIINLRADPYERAPDESGMYIRWYGDLLWLFVPIQERLKEFFADFEDYPYQLGTSLNAGNINYNTLQARQAFGRLQQLEEFMPGARN
ncbi:arylsulfatase [Geminicoccus roseus]|uniref:arylsulfatase n=1 Tax=Geminicoccus roseus TaxID=404900 RepID=UPI000404DAA5|nr:arylsulfatase [Geminicoccus roseus]